MHTLKRYLIFLLQGFIFIGCQRGNLHEESTAETDLIPLFTRLLPDHTKIDFSNNLTEGLNTNVLMYEYFYNGGGVAVGDVNNDGWDDIYFTSNMETNRLYLNKGNMRFEDVTQAAGVGSRKGPWKTGVTMVDINGDDLLDIYVAYSGNLRPDKRKNELFINHGADASGVPQFKEQANKFGLDIPAATTQAFFFDYDRDGDLDAFILNHNIHALPELNETATATVLQKEDALNGVRLFNNDQGYFRDVTVSTGLSSSALTYGLGAGVADINGDGWPDIYVSNDYNVPDYLYINEGNGTFSNRLQSSMGHTSQFSMGNDVADINNDGYPDIFTLDMLPEDNQRQKLLMAPDNYAKFDLNLRVGFYYQYMRNMLQLNNGDGTFSEIGQLAGISNTDWSWAPLFADYDNDGWKDLLITNGYQRDYTNLDFIKYMDNYVQQKGRLKREDVLALVHRIPASDVVNYLYRNNGDLTFSNMTAAWGIDRPSNSNGAAYADLDNDGDLDLVMNNINQPAFIYRNEASRQAINHYLRIRLKGAGRNTAGLGAKITAYLEGMRQYLEQMPSRGYQSSVSPVLHLGLGHHTMVDSLLIVWPGGKCEMLRKVQADQVITLHERAAEFDYKVPRIPPEVFKEVKPTLIYQHQKISINDFKRQPLLTNPLSFSGPCMVKADVNRDGLEDVYIGGGYDQPGALFLQQNDGQFMPTPQPAFEADKVSDDTDALFFDANGDQYPDLYVCSGGYHDYEPEDEKLQDRLYLNDGKGNFRKAPEALPVMRTSSACVRRLDVNGDGHPDLFIGGRVVPGRYPESPTSYLLVNNGKGLFKDMTSAVAPVIRTIGMVTDARCTDLNQDGKDDLILVGEWMPVTVLIQNNGKLTDKTATYFDKKYSGWWNTISTGDFNHDARIDLVIGNHGLNTQCKVSDEEPGELYYKDFDNNGSVDPVLCFYIQGKSYPYLSRDELLEQIGMMRPRFPDYKSYASATLKDVFKPEELDGATRKTVNTLRSTYFEQDAGGRFREKALPREAQFSPVYSITVLDYNKDGNFDLLLCGNITKARLKFGKNDANYGVLLRGDGKGNFVYIPQHQSGFSISGDVRSVLQVDEIMFFGINQGYVKAYTIR